MLAQTLQIHRLCIPFRTRFAHASASRESTASLLVKIESMQGVAGFGEGCPREYVTGETLESATHFLRSHARKWLQSICDIATLRNQVVQHRSLIDANPSAWAAAELAVLDLLGKTQHTSVEALLGVQPVRECFRYTAVLGDAMPEQFEAQIQRYLQAGFRDFKIKLSGDSARDQAKIASLRRHGIAPERVRADANNLWPTATEAIASLLSLDYAFHAIEEPLRCGDHLGMRAIADALATRIVLDESFLRAEQFAALQEDAHRWIINLRVSKMGGLLRSLEVLEQARAAKIGINIGAHVGETSLLTRAALTIAANAEGCLLHQEGAFGTHLLQQDVTVEPLTFGLGGVLDTGERLSAAPGFGISVAEDGLRSFLHAV